MFVKVQNVYYEKEKVRSIRLIDADKVRVWLLPDNTFMDHLMTVEERAKFQTYLEQYGVNNET
jgi:hypothetical protein